MTHSLWMLLPALVSANPQEAETLYTQAKLASEEAKWPKVLELCNQAIPLMPLRSELWRMRAQAKRNLKDLDGAWTDVEKALELDPKNPKAWNGRGQIRYQRKDYAGALVDLDQALRLDPGYVNGWSFRADVKEALKDLPGAMADTEQALRLEPKRHDNLLRRGNLRLDLKYPARAVADYQEALKLKPDYWPAAYNLALAQVALNNPDAAIAGFSSCIRAEHRTAQAHHQRGKQYRILGNKEAAIEDFKAALALDPNIKEAAKALEELKAGSTVRAEAKKAATKGLKLPMPPKAGSDELWTKPMPGSLAISVDSSPLELGSASPKAFTSKLPDGQTRYAMEAFKAAMGPLEAREESKFQSKWQPYFDFPTPESEAYFADMGESLQELNATRALVARSSNALDRHWLEAVGAAAVGDSLSATEHLEQASHHHRALQSANARLKGIAQKVEKAGNPPNPKEAKQRAKARFVKHFEGPSEWSRMAYLWRMSQMDSINVDNRLSVNMENSASLQMGKPASRVYHDVWPADEATWCKWLEGGKQGPEPKGPAPSKEQLKTAHTFVNQAWPHPPNESFDDGMARVSFFKSYPAEKAAADILAKRKIGGAQAPVVKEQPNPTPPPQPPPAPPAPPDQKAQEEEAKAKQESIREHETNIAFVKRMLDKDRAEWAREKDPTRKEELYRRILINDAEIQRMGDLVHQLKTGEERHTRTAADQFSHDLMIRQSEQQIASFEKKLADIEAASKVAAFMHRQIFEAPLDQRKQLADFVSRQLRPEDLAKGDLGKAKQVCKVMFDNLQARRELDAARAEVAAVDADDYYERAVKVRNRASLALMVVGLGGPIYLSATGAMTASTGTAVTVTNAVYGATTGYMEGGLVEGVRQAVAMTSLPGLVAAEAFAGYQQGGFLTKGGVAGAIERGAEAFLLGKAIEIGAGKIGAWYAGKAKTAPSGGSLEAPKSLTLGELVDQESFKFLKKQAESKIAKYREIHDKLVKARQAKDAVQIAELEAQRLKLATDLNEDFLAKRLLKARGAEGRKADGNPVNAALEDDFARAQDALYKGQVDPAFKGDVKAAGYHWRKKTPGGQWQKAGDLQFKDYRHKSSTDIKTANTDRDLGLVEEANRPGEIWQLYKGNERVSLSDAQDDLQRIYEGSYKRATGGDPKAAGQELTTSVNGEAYRDLNYTKMGGKPENATAIQKGWADQAMEVTQKKISLPKGDPLADTLIKKIDGANQAAKDVKERLLPYLKAKKAPAEDIQLFEKIQKALEGMERDPIQASRELKFLTGMDSVAGVTEKISKRFIGVVKTGR